MNWDAVGAIGELFGALAVVLTLGYLAVQVRQNSQGMKVAAKLEIENNFNEYTNLILKDPELFDLQRKGLLGQELEADDKVKFALLMQRMTRQFSSMYYQYQIQDLSEDEWYESHRLIRWFTFSPAIKHGGRKTRKTIGRISETTSANFSSREMYNIATNVRHGHFCDGQDSILNGCYGAILESTLSSPIADARNVPD